MIKNFFKAIFKLCLLGLALIAVYFVIAFLLVLFPENMHERASESSIEAYVRSNGVHTDVVLPIRSADVDWTEYFPTSDAKAAPADAAYIAIGWGDKEFYLNTPNWSDLTASRAVSALIGRDTTLLHVTYLTQAELGERYKIGLDAQQYTILKQYILDAAPLKDGRAIAVAGAHYEDGDAFYEAHGQYSMVNTCNTWLGDGLRRAGVPMSRWTPLDQLVVWHLPKVLE